MLNISAIKLVPLAILIALISCRAKPQTNLQFEGKTLLSEEKTTWGYGCGYNCSFNSDGNLSTTLSFQGSDSIEMKTSGQFMNVIHYPNSFILEAKKWSYDYGGTWQDLADGFHLELKLSKSECTLQRSEGKKKTSLPCESPQKIRELICRIGEMQIPKLSNSVLICEDEDKNQTAFGIGETITKVVVGEPSIKTHFYVNKGFNK